MPMLGLVVGAGLTIIALQQTQQQCMERKVIGMEQPQLQGKGNGVRYMGHGANTGGLQAHSIGWEYPYTVIGVQRGPEGALRWAVMDTRNGQLGADKATQRECTIEIASLKIRNMMHG